MAATFNPHRQLFVLNLLFNLFITSPICSHSIQISSGTKLNLIHRHSLLKNRANVSKLGRIKQLAQNDAVRLISLSDKAQFHREQMPMHRRRVLASNFYDKECNNGSRNRNVHHHVHSNVSGELSIHSGADYGTAEYFVHFKIGSPAQRVVLIMDTGSDLTWTNCAYRCRGGGSCGRSFRKKRVFSADRSSSFRTVPCSSRTCKVDLANLFSINQCSSPMDPCAYDYRYSEGASAIGLFANETVTFSLTNGRKTRLHNVLVGCTESSNGPSFRAVDGVMGLGYSNYSLAVRATKRFGGKFSYCLVDHLSPKNVSSYLIFGSHEQEEAVTFNRMRYTELVLGEIPPFYAVNVKGISLGGSMLKIPAEVWNVSGVGGVIFDSGSSLTALAQPAYAVVMATLRRSLLNFSNLNLNIGPLEYCFNSTGFDESFVPRLVFHFTDGARFEPLVKSYVIDAAEGVKCLGFQNATWPGISVIGNIMQQNYFWEYDLAKSRLGFASSSCISIDS